MPTINIETLIQASREVCFDLSRSIDLHKVSMAGNGEEAIAGRTEGLIGPGETVTWKARHFGIRQTLTSKITAFERPTFFADKMVRGAFKSFRHEHRFDAVPEGTKMIDVFTYKSPLGIIGRLADIIFLKRYMTSLLKERNAVLKKYAEEG